MKKRICWLLVVLLAFFSVCGAEGISPDSADVPADSELSAQYYEHDPRENPTAMRDIVVNPEAVYGFSPSPAEESTLKDYADSIDWTDPEQVAAARAQRQEYHDSLQELYDMILAMMDEDQDIETIAKAVSKRRNELRLEIYKDDPDGLATVKKRNLETYGNEEGPTTDWLYEKYGSWEMVLIKALGTNAGMDACLGFYDEYYYLYELEEEEDPEESGELPDEPEYIGIISAMQSEVDLLLSQGGIERVDTVGSVEFHVGTLCGQRVVIAKGGVGKVLAASGVTAMLNRYPISKVIFTGVAGGVGDETKVLNEVIATRLVQHDYGEINADGFSWFEGTHGEAAYRDCDPALVELAYESAVLELGEESVFRGIIATGDQFIASEAYVKKLQEEFGAIACEMEGAAVAVVCAEYGIPFVVIRAMSDKADGLAHESYENLVELAADQSCRIVMRMLDQLTVSGSGAVPGR